MNGTINSRGEFCNSAGEAFEPQPTIKVLDRGYIDGRLALLDGKGNALPPRTEAVFIDVPVYGMQVNSLGVPFVPQIMWDELSTPKDPDQTDYA